MSTRRGRLLGIALVLVLAVVGGGVATLVLATSGKASNVELTTAQFVPADAAAYVGFNTDLSSSQWLAAFGVARRLGKSNPKQDLHQAANDGGVDWNKEVAPFLGGNAAVYVRTADLDNFSGAAVIRCADAGKALSIIEDKGDLTLQDGTHDRVPYRFDADKHAYLARLGSHLVLASDEQSLFDVLDVHAGKKASLATAADFKTLRDDLTGSFLGFVYLNAEQFLHDGIQGTVEQALGSVSTAGVALKPTAMVIGAHAGAIDYQSATVGTGGPAAPLLQVRDSHLAKFVPADTAIFVSLGGLAETWKQVTGALKGQIDSALQDEGYNGGLDDVLQSAAAQVGLNSPDDLVNVFSGETAVAAWFPSGKSGSDPTGVFLAEVKDAQTARSVLRTVVNSDPSAKPRSEKVSGADVTYLTSDDGQEIAYTVTDGYLAISTRGGLRTLLTRQGGSLADSDAYKRTVAQMPTRLGTFAYLDLAGLINQAGAGSLPSEVNDTAQYLQGLIINLVEDRGLTRLSGVVTTR